MYASVDTSSFHTAAYNIISTLEAQNTQLWISRQVMREYLATLIRPTISIPTSDLINIVRAFELRYQIAEESPLVTAQLLTFLDQGISRHVHDTNIVATMLTYGIRRIITNNPKDLAPFSSLIMIVPLI